MHFGPWEIAAFGGLWIGAFLLAADVGLRMAPNIRTRLPRLERFQESGWWGFTPFVLLTLSGAILLFNALGWLPVAQPNADISKTWEFVAPAMLLVFVLLMSLLRRRKQNTQAKGTGADIIERISRIEAAIRMLGTVTTETAGQGAISIVHAISDRIDGLTRQVGDYSSQVSDLQKQIERERKQTEMQLRMVTRAIRARDAEGIIKDADQTVASLAPKLLEGPYPDEAAWAADYNQWKSAMARIDGILSDWQQHHNPYLDIRVSDLERNGAPSPPSTSSIKSDMGATRYKTVWLAQQSYANHREGMLIYFSSKAGELPH